MAGLCSPLPTLRRVLANANARLGVDVDRYTFIVVDLHHLLLAGLPAHFESHMPSHAVRFSPSLLDAKRFRCHVRGLGTGGKSSFFGVMNGFRLKPTRGPVTLAVALIGAAVRLAALLENARVPFDSIRQLVDPALVLSHDMMSVTSVLRPSRRAAPALVNPISVSAHRIRNSRHNDRNSRCRLLRRKAHGVKVATITSTGRRTNSAHRFSSILPRELSTQRWGSPGLARASA
jgi:hypothetical protein